MHFTEKLLPTMLDLLATEPAVGQQVFAVEMVHNSITFKAVSALLIAAHIDPDKTDEWPLDDVEFDSYDESFEFKGVKLGWEPTEEILAAWWALGFERCWICYTDETEKQYHA